MSSAAGFARTSTARSEEGVPTRASDADPGGEFRVTSNDSLHAIIDDYLAACEESRVVCARVALDDSCRADGCHTLRWMYLHMIEETARHAGHIDILREQLDGFTGD